MQIETIKLTKRQREVVRLASLGCTIEETAAILGVSKNTLDNHRSRAMSLLGMRRLQLLTRFAIQHGISPIGDRLTDEEKNLQRVAALQREVQAIRDFSYGRFSRCGTRQVLKLNQPPAQAESRLT